MIRIPSAQAIASLKPETADEEALQQLAERPWDLLSCWKGQGLIFFKMGMSENGVQTPNEIAIIGRDNDQQNHWVSRGLANIFRQTQMVLAEKILKMLEIVHFQTSNSGFGILVGKLHPKKP